MADEDTIRNTYAGLIVTARRHTPFGVLTARDLAGLQKRTASICRVSIRTVQEVING